MIFSDILPLGYMIRYAPSMEQPFDSKKSFFSARASKEASSFIKLAVPMFLTQLALQLIQVNSVVQSGNSSTDVQAGIMLALCCSGERDSTCLAGGTTPVTEVGQKYSK